jgi:hypothetical protein
MGGFVRQRRGGQLVATFSGLECDLLRSLAAQVIELLEDGRPQRDTRSDDPLAALFDFADPVHEPGDPVLLRWLPNAYPDDEEASSEFRRFTESTLRQGKVANAQTLLDDLLAAGVPDPLGEADGDNTMTFDIVLEQASALAWLKSLTDIRLALATRMGYEEGEEEFWMNLGEPDPRYVPYQLFGWLGAVQETLVEALSR